MRAGNITSESKLSPLPYETHQSVGRSWLGRITGLLYKLLAPTPRQPNPAPVCTRESKKRDSAPCPKLHRSNAALAKNPHQTPRACDRALACPRYACPSRDSIKHAPNLALSQVFENSLSLALARVSPSQLSSPVRGERMPVEGLREAVEKLELLPSVHSSLSPWPWSAG